MHIVIMAMLGACSADTHNRLDSLSLSSDDVRAVNLPGDVIIRFTRGEGGEQKNAAGSFHVEAGWWYAVKPLTNEQVYAIHRSEWDRPYLEWMDYVIESAYNVTREGNEEWYLAYKRYMAVKDRPFLVPDFSYAVELCAQLAAISKRNVRLPSYGEWLALAEDDLGFIQSEQFKSGCTAHLLVDTTSVREIPEAFLALERSLERNVPLAYIGDVEILVYPSDYDRRVLRDYAAPGGPMWRDKVEALGELFNAEYWLRRLRIGQYDVFSCGASVLYPKREWDTIFLPDWAISNKSHPGRVFLPSSVFVGVVPIVTE